MTMSRRAVQAAVAREKESFRARAERRVQEQAEADRVAVRAREEAKAHKKKKGALVVLRDALVRGDDEVASASTQNIDPETLVSALDADGSTALHWAAARGLVETATKILARQDVGAAAVVATDIRGLTPLHSAAGSDPTGEMCAAIAAHPACRAWTRDKKGRTPLDVATQVGLLEAAAAIFKAVAPAPPSRMKTIAAAEDAGLDILVEAEESVASTDVAGDVAGDVASVVAENISFSAGLDAVAAGHREEAMALASNKGWPFVNETDHRGRTLLHNAAARGWAEVCTALLAREEFHLADALDKERSTALHVAVASRRLECCEAIVSCGRFWAVNERDLQGRTPLHLAALRGDADCYQAVLEHRDCNPAVPDLKGKLAPEYAAERGLDVELPAVVGEEIVF